VAGIEGDGLEQHIELVAAALNVADGVGGHLSSPRQCTTERMLSENGAMGTSKRSPSSRWNS
jgi:hypothetical protein